MGTHKEHKKKHHHHHHHKRSGHSSPKSHHKSKSKHHHRKNHRHHHHKKKSHHRRHETIELQLDDKVLQNALDCLEAGALNAIKDDSKLTPEALDNLVQSTITNAQINSANRAEDSEDSDSTSNSSLDSDEHDISKDVATKRDKRDSCSGGKGDAGTSVEGRRHSVGDKEVRRKPENVEGEDGKASRDKERTDGVSRDKQKSVVKGIVVHGKDEVDNATDNVEVEVASSKAEAVGSKDKVVTASTSKKNNVKDKSIGAKVAGDVRLKVKTDGAKVTAGGAMVKVDSAKVKGSVDSVKASGAKVVADVAKSKDVKVVKVVDSELQAVVIPGPGAKVKTTGSTATKDSPKPAVAKDAMDVVPTGESERSSTTIECLGRGSTPKGRAMAMIGEISSDDDSDDDDDDLPIHPKKIGTRGAIKINISQSLRVQPQLNSKAPSEAERSSKPATARSEASKVTYVNLKSGNLSGKKSTGDSVKTKTPDKKSSGNDVAKTRLDRRSRTRSKSPSRKKRHSRNSHRSHSRSRHRSRSRPRHKSRSRSRRRSHSRSRQRSRSRRRRSVSRDTSRHLQSRRKSNRSRSRSRRRRRRSKRSRTGSTSRNRTSRSTSRSYSRSRSPVKPSKVIESIPMITKGLSKAKEAQTKKKSITKLTDFCKNLQKKQKIEDKGGPVDEPAPVEYRAPYVVNAVTAYQPGLVFHNNTWKTAHQIIAEANSISMAPPPLTNQFPVSTGLQHKQSVVQEEVQGGVAGQHIFPGQQAVDITDVAIKRVLATERLKINPGDVEAISILVDVEQKTQVWAQSKAVPGKFTGEPKLKPLTRDDHKVGLQAWAKKNMFRDLAPVMSGFGMKMLTKMGWEVGKPLGKMGVGHIAPIPVEVKLDRSGLSTKGDSKKPSAAAAAAKRAALPDSAILFAPTLHAADKRGAHLVEGKHPVSALQEICGKKRWPNPDYKMVECEGPAHKKTFLFEVTIPLGTFRSANGSKNKKNARMEAATAALQGLGLLKKPPPTSAGSAPPAGTQAPPTATIPPQAQTSSST